MKPAYHPTHYSKRITEAILSVYDNADFDDKQKINKLTNPLMDHCKGMSREGSIEVLGKIGIWLAQDNKKL